MLGGGNRMRVRASRSFDFVNSINTNALAGQASSGDYVSISVLKMALDSQQSEGAQLVAQLQPSQQLAPSSVGNAGSLVDIYA